VFRQFECPGLQILLTVLLADTRDLPKPRNNNDLDSVAVTGYMLILNKVNLQH